jgi:hypothetical protein
MPCARNAANAAVDPDKHGGGAILAEFVGGGLQRASLDPLFRQKRSIADHDALVRNST